MENLPSSSSCTSIPSHAQRPHFSGHNNPFPGIQSSTIPPIQYHLCHCFTFLVACVSRIFKSFRHPSELHDSNPADGSMHQTSASLFSPTDCQGNQNATASTTRYQVFINHRGSDAKKTLASTIYHWLQGKGLQVFLDKDEFEPGQPLKSTIEDAIRTSSVHVAIFSKRYAESDWCLKELCLMLQTGVPIIPVFYNVRPKDLRWIEKGEYASTFKKHENKGRDEGQLLRSLEDTVLRNLKPVPLEVLTDSAGLDEAICDFENFVESRQQSENKKVKIVGIVGLGGSGKTTLAKEFFNRKSSLFERTGFLFDLRDASNRNTLPSLQSKLLQDLLRMKGCKISNVNEGKAIIREKLQSLPCSVVIVLDRNQVEDLRVKDVWGSGSLIIIISREEEP